MRAGQERALGPYLRHEVCAYSAAHRRRLDTAAITSTSALARVTPIAFADISDPTPYVLHPQASTISSSGTWEMRGRLAFAQMTRRVSQMERGLIERRYKPVHWILSRSVPIGYSHRDLSLLAEIGRQSLEGAGVGVNDTIVSLLAPGPNLAYWQVLLGAQRAGVSIIGLSPGVEVDAIVALEPTVIAASAATLERLAGQLPDPLAEVRTVVAAAVPGDHRLPAVERLSRRSDAATVCFYAPPGVKSLWAQCRGGEGLHTWPWAEIVQEGESELVWSALDWRGTVFMRLATGVGGHLDWTQCPKCRRSTPRVLELGPPRAAPVSTAKAPAAVGAAPIRPAVAREVPAPRERVKVTAVVAPTRPTKAPAPVAAKRAAVSAPPVSARPVSAPPVKVEDEEFDVDIEGTLDEHPGVKTWSAELRTVDRYDELIIYLVPAGGGHPGRLVRELDAALDVTQFVICDPYDVADRIKASGGERVVDLRP